FMYLYIDTSNYSHIFLALLDNKGAILIFKKIKAEYKQSEKLLENINKILNNNAKKTDGIICVIGPGGFTSLRIGIATANAIAWALNIPIIGIENKFGVNGQDLISAGYKKIIKIKNFKQILPKYGAEPNITLKK
ncbi:MAG: tRNA (adenosine(37)-N6)-threonylcarbamoyltransferase complex dimerization subunit type 1 TsaB, partial [Patescibacteria group bacterium]